MNFIKSKNGTRFLSFEDSKAGMKQYIAFLEAGPGVGMIAQRVDMFKDEAINTLVAAMYSGRSMIDGTAGEIKDTPDEEIIYSAETCGCLTGDRDIAKMTLVSKNAECVARYLSRFILHFAGQAVVS